MLWALSAGAGGDIRSTNLKLVTDAPFLMVDRFGLLPETLDLYNSFSKYVTGLMEGPTYLGNMMDVLSVMVPEANQLVRDFQTENSRAEISHNTMVRGIGALGTNRKLLPPEANKCMSLVPLVLEVSQDSQELLDYLPQMIEEADVVGMRAFQERVLKPADIFDRYHQGQKKSSEELAMSQAVVNHRLIKRQQKK